jgi:hypothetical protein
MKRLAISLHLIALVCSHAEGQTVLDPGFESYDVASGGFTKDASGPWIFNNDAGIVEPFSPHSSNGPLDTWSATFAPFEGDQYASAYAGSDWFDQDVTFPAAGNYQLSVWAASPSGTVSIVGGPMTLTTGDFRFAVGGSVVGSTFSPPLDAGWNRYMETVQINSHGVHRIGVHTTKTAPYFIDFDMLTVAVPEPSTSGLLLSGLVGLAFLGRQRRRLFSHSGAAAPGSLAARGSIAKS